MLILSRWVDLVPLCVNWIVPSRSPWGATSGEELTSALYRWVSDCHSMPSGGRVDICLVWVLFADLSMLSVLDACDFWAVLSWSGESVWGLSEMEGFCFVHVSRVILCHRSQDFLESILYLYPVGTFWCGMCRAVSACCSVSICRSSFSFFLVTLSCCVFPCFFLLRQRHRIEASFQSDLIAVVPVVLLGLGSIAAQISLAIRPWRKLSHPMCCCCVVLGCENGVWSSHVSPPSSFIALVAMAAHFGPVVLHFVMSFVVRLVMAFRRHFFGVSWLHAKTWAVSSVWPQKGQLFGSQ
jgi:uncharacterized membrane protein YhaH (DUF805 family)